MAKRKTLGYGYKRRGETLDEALNHYLPTSNGAGLRLSLFSTHDGARFSIEFDRKEGSIGPKERPKIFRVEVLIDE